MRSELDWCEKNQISLKDSLGKWISELKEKLKKLKTSNLAMKNFLIIFGMEQEMTVRVHKNQYKRLIQIPFEKNTSVKLIK